MMRHWLTGLGVLSAHPAAFILFSVYCLGWLIFGDGFHWHELATMATWGMTLVIQRAEHRDTQAIHAKLDELLKVNGDADSELMNVDQEDAEEIEAKREQVRDSAA